MSLAGAYLTVNMTAHRYSLGEMADVTGRTTNDLASVLLEPNIQPLHVTNTLLVLPYPGGRHPRIGFLDGAIDPQRETKFTLREPLPQTRLWAL